MDKTLSTIGYDKAAFAAFSANVRLVVDGAARLGKNSTAAVIRRAFAALRCSRPEWSLRFGARKHPPGGAKQRL